MKTIIFFALLLLNLYFAYCIGWTKRARDTGKAMLALLDEAKASEMDINTFVDKLLHVQTDTKEPLFIRAIGYVYDKFKKQPTN